MITGNIDLSVGSVAGLTGAIVAMLQVHFLPGILPEYISSPLLISLMSITITIILGALIGLWHGFLISYASVPSFIVTLGGMLFFRGAVLGVTKGITISPLLPDFRILGSGYMSHFTGYLLAVIIILIIWGNFLVQIKNKNQLPWQEPLLDFIKNIIISFFIIILTLILNSYRGIPNPVLIMIVLGFIFNYISKHTSFGRYVFAIGGNTEASRLAGINVKLNLLIVFVLIGVLTAISGIILTARLNAATNSAGNMFELSAITACAIGGISLFGGKGSILNAIIGALIIASIDNGMSMINIEMFWQQMIKGLILIGVVWLDISYQRKAYVKSSFISTGT